MATRPAPAAALLSVFWPAAAVVVTALALGGIGSGLGNPDQLVTSSFVTALNSQSGVADRGSGSSGSSGLVQLSGSEEFWLNARSPAAGAVPVVLRESLQPGDRVTIGTGASERRYDVVDIRSIGDAAQAGGGTAHVTPLLLVTCRDAVTPDAPPLRFVIERTELPAGSVRRTPHAL